jgi:predicted SAM-dependent methyltransferase
MSVQNRILQLIKLILSDSTIQHLKWDFIRTKTRTSNYFKKNQNESSKLHLGCGNRLIKGWLNVDLINSDFNVDLATGNFPFKDNSFETIVSQHLIEHLDFDSEFLPFLSEIKRISKPGADIWLTTPDMHTICKLYINGKSEELLIDRKKRWPSYNIEGKPTQHMLNEYFHQRGEHKNLFDYDLLSWALDKAGFCKIEEKTEKYFLDLFTEFPRRGDNATTLYVAARAK